MSAESERDAASVAVEIEELSSRIEQLFTETPGSAMGHNAREIIERLLTMLEAGVVRSAHRDAAGAWSAVSWVKRGILVGFRVGAQTKG